MSSEKYSAESLDEAQDDLNKIVMSPSNASMQPSVEEQDKTRITNNRMEAMQPPPQHDIVVESASDSADNESKWTQQHIGTIIAGRYRILGLLGVGGMGSVFRAEHIMLGTFVAVKILNHDLQTNTKALKRFAQEAKAASSLKHSNIATVSDYGLTESGFPYFVMDLISGNSLSDLIDEKSYLPWEQAVDFGIQIADAMGYAHFNGIVHRDLKPGNIIISPGGKGEERATVVDFGIAKFANESQEARDAQKLTQTGEVFGSPLYMSPEQCRGSAMDGRSDIYSFGCMLYEMVTGEVPFCGINAVQTILMQINDPPPPPRLRASDGNQAITTLPGGLETVIMHCLAKEPTDRYSSMDDVKADLQLVKKGLPPTCKSVKRLRFKLKAPSLLQTGLVTAIGTITIFLGMAFWINKWQYEMVPWQRDFAQAKKELERAEYIPAMMSSKHGIKLATERKAPKHELAALYIMLGDSYRSPNSNNFSEAHKAYEQAISIATDKDSAKQQVLASDKLGEIESSAGNYKEALERYDRALASFTDRYSDNVEKARLYVHKGLALEALKQFDAASREFNQAISLYKTMDAVNTPALSAAYAELAKALQAGGDPAAAQKAREEAEALKKTY